MDQKKLLGFCRNLVIVCI